MDVHFIPRTHQGVVVAEIISPVGAQRLISSALELNSLLLHQTNREQSRLRNSCNRAEINSESKDRIVVVDSTKVCILSVAQLARIDELVTHGGICARLEGQIGNVSGRVVKVTPQGLIRGF